METLISLANRKDARRQIACNGNKTGVVGLRAGGRERRVNRNPWQTLQGQRGRVDLWRGVFEWLEIEGETLAV